MPNEMNETLKDEARPMFRSVRPEIGSHATVEISSTIQASGRLTRLGPDGQGAVNIDGRDVVGTLVPSVRRLTLTEPASTIKDKDDAHDDPAPY